MKIYFTASMSGKEKYQGNYEKIVKTLEEMGHTVYEETVNISKKYVYEEISDDEKLSYYKQVLKWMNKADLVVVEATHSSLSIGHELTVALEKGKPVVVLHAEGNAPHFLHAVKNERLIVEKYDLKSLKNVPKVNHE